MIALEEQVSATVDLIGVLVALITLFTVEQQRRLDQENLRVGGGLKTVRVNARNLTIGLCLATGLTIGVLAPLFFDALGTFSFGAPANAVLSVFSLIWLLLGALLVWQIGLLLRVRKELR